MTYRILKRLFDVCASIIGILILLPFSLLIGCAIKLNSHGSIFVKLDRISQGKIIPVFKFRTMIEGANKLKNGLSSLNERKDGPFFKIKNDPRITRVGFILRKHLIDELPQLLNVLLGHLSLVGPRPHEPEETQSYPENYRHILLAKAGITGLSQINGASNLPFLKELEFDNQYLKNQSLYLDLKIIIKTIKIFFTEANGV